MNFYLNYYVITIITGRLGEFQMMRNTMPKQHKHSTRSASLQPLRAVNFHQVETVNLKVKVEVVSAKGEYENLIHIQPEA